MTMFWIYIPPIILVAALAALVIILGRKSSDLKRIKSFEAPTGEPAKKTGWNEKMNSAGRKMLHALEKILFFVKFVFKQTEQLVSSWAGKLSARRNRKKSDNIENIDFSAGSKEDKIIREIEKTEEISSTMTEKDRGTAYGGSEVVIRRRIPDEPVIPPKREPLSEDKVRESALIYRIAENPRDIEAYREIGDYYMGIGNIKDAKESFKMVLKLRPRDLKAKSSLREIEMRMRLGS